MNREHKEDSDIYYITLKSLYMIKITLFVKNAIFYKTIKLTLGLGHILNQRFCLRDRSLRLSTFSTSILFSDKNKNKYKVKFLGTKYFHLSIKCIHPH